MCASSRALLLLLLALALALAPGGAARQKRGKEATTQSRAHHHGHQQQLVHDDDLRSPGLASPTTAAPQAQPVTQPAYTVLVKAAVRAGATLDSKPVGIYSLLKLQMHHIARKITVQRLA